MQSTRVLFAATTLLVASCTQPTSATNTVAAPQTTAASGNATPVVVNGIPVEQLAGVYNGDWGTMHLVHAGGGELRGAYSHSNGRVVARVDGDVVRGTWCQDEAAEGHRPNGSVEFRFSRNAANVIALDGRWTYADAPDNWQENWDVTLSGPANEQLAARAPAAACSQ
ncbi:MAG: hypothetical protein JNK05_11995 [Myxococcales bacterium]|nr:hypothetical protein [Myxococcales bacterium]